MVVELLLSLARSAEEVVDLEKLGTDRESTIVALTEGRKTELAT